MTPFPSNPLPMSELWHSVRGQCLPTECVALAPVPTEASPTLDRYAGDPARPHGPWPGCPACGKSLTFVAQFRARGRFWRFFYCMQCNPWDDDERESGLVRLESEPLDAQGEPESHPQLQRSPATQGLVPRAWVRRACVNVPSPEDKAALDTSPLFAKWLLHTRLPQAEQEQLFAAWGAVGEGATRIGGYAYPIQGAIEPHCPQCHQAMPLLARLASEQEVNLMWGDMGVVYLHACAAHPEQVHFELQCY